MTRLNVRIRRRLFGSLMAQDAAFFDGTKTGDITSRLSSDTTTVSDQICLNLNVMLRSSTQVGVGGDCGDVLALVCGWVGRAPIDVPSQSIDLNTQMLPTCTPQAAIVLLFMFSACWRLTVVRRRPPERIPTPAAFPGSPLAHPLTCLRPTLPPPACRSRL